MSYKPVEFGDFKSLDLNPDAQEAGAIDILNVIFDRKGVVRTRNGTTSCYTAAATIDGIMKWPDKYGLVVFGTGSNIYVIDAQSTATATLQGTTASATYPIDFVNSPAATNYGYFLDGGTHEVRRIDLTATVSTPAGIPVGASCIALQTPSSRLVLGDAGTTTGKVHFSDEGAPETFSANNYVTLPQAVVALVNWNDQLFAFCPDRIFVFYGNSTSTTGTPEFNYRLVSANIGAAGAASSAVAMDDGVYFISAHGVYKTTGGPPVKVSGPIDPLFNATSTPPYFVGAGTPPASGLARIFGGGGRIYVDAQATNGYWLVYEIATQQWTYWQISKSYYLLPEVWVYGATKRLVCAEFNGTSITRMDPTATSDNSTAIVSRYRAGFWNPGAPATESVVREFLLDGSGTVDFKTSVDDAITLGSAASVTLGTAPATVQGRDRRAVKGRNVSWQVGASSGAWSLSRLVGNVRSSRGAGPDGT